MLRSQCHLLIAGLLLSISCLANDSPASSTDEHMLSAIQQKASGDCLALNEIPGLVGKTAMPSYCGCVRKQVEIQAKSSAFLKMDFKSPANLRVVERLERVAFSYCTQFPLIEAASRDAATRCESGAPEYNLPNSSDADARRATCTCIAGYVARSPVVELGGDDVPIDAIKQNTAAMLREGIAACKGK